jgi:class 3 adenylate cyclase
MATTRRVAAILAADVAGYSRLMGADEGTDEPLKAHLRELLDPKIKEHHCRTVENTGDGLLPKLPSVVEAARCAAEMRRVIYEQITDVDALWARGDRECNCGRKTNHIIGRRKHARADKCHPS